MFVTDATVVNVVEVVVDGDVVKLSVRYIVLGIGTRVSLVSLKH